MKCKVCGKRMKLLAKDRYDVYVRPVGLNCLTQGVTHYEAFDCPRCGCQNIVNVREEQENEVDSEGTGDL
jgi:DNA-directed RNA polymerase subunit RPC12/RpoP